MSNNLAFSSKNVLLPILGNTASEKSNYNYYPLLSGDKFPSFLLDHSAFISIKDQDIFTAPATSLQDILDYPQPLVIAFLSVTDKIEDLAVWESLQSDINIMGGRLLIITNGNERQFTHKIRKENKLNIWQDKNLQLSEKVGLYDFENPISDWLSGVEDNIAIPAFYLIAKNQNIVFHHIDYALKTIQSDRFSDSPFVRNLLTSVYQNTSEKSLFLRKAIS